MIDALRLTFGWALVWASGIAVILATTRPSALDRPGERAWIAGCGFFVGAFLLTLWMRGLSLAGIRFSLASIGLPVAVATIGAITLPLDGWKAATPAACTLPMAGANALLSEKYASCAVTMLRASLFIDASTAFCFVLANFGIAIAARMPMITTTISSSMRVKPLRFMLRFLR